MDLQTRAAIVRDLRLELKADDFDTFRRLSVIRDARDPQMLRAAKRNVRQMRRRPGMRESFSIDRDQAVLGAAGKIRRAGSASARATFGGR